jgi:hypothetical protein
LTQTETDRRIKKAQPIVHLWDWIKSACTKRMASQKALYAKKHTQKDPLFPDRLVHIQRTGGLKAACGGKQRRNTTLIKPQQGEYESPHQEPGFMSAA